MTTKKKKTTKVTKPDVARYAASRSFADESFIKYKVAPYLLQLLDTAQEKTAGGVSFIQGMGTAFIDFDENRTWARRTDAFSSAVQAARLSRGRKTTYQNKDQHQLYFTTHFPELIELMLLVWELAESGMQVGDLRPRTFPATFPTEADRAWKALVED